MLIKNLLVLMFYSSLIIVSACSPKGPTQNNNNDNSYHYHTNQELDRATAGFSISCSGECPSNVGVLLIKDYDRKTLFQCTFSLVADDIILTNRHCIINAIASSGQSCTGAIEALFMDDYGNKQTFHCAEVLSVPTEYQTQPIVQRDFAFLRLDKSTGRTPLKIDGISGSVDNEILTAFTATPYADGDEGATLVKKNCTVHMNSLVLPTFTLATDPVILLDTCDVVHGNSGSPLLDTEGEIKGVVQAFLSDVPQSTDTRVSAELEESFNSQNYSLATNSVCFLSPELGLTPQASCFAKHETYSLSLNSTKNNESLIDHLKSIDEEMLAQHRGLLRFKKIVGATQDPHKIKAKDYTYTPECIESIPKTDQELSVNLKKLSTWVDLDKDGRYIMAWKDKSENVNFKVSTIQIPLKVYAVTATSSDNSQQNFYLPVCADQTVE